MKIQLLRCRFALRFRVVSAAGVALLAALSTMTWAEEATPASRPQANGPQANGPAAVRNPSARSPEKSATPSDEDWARFGPFRYHKPTRQIEIDGRFNIERGPVEFLACAPGVKAHETIVAVPGNPSLLNLALLLQGHTVVPDARPSNDEDLDFIPGDRVVVELRFEVDGENGEKIVKTVRAEDAIINRLTGETMRRVGFVYTGSEHIPADPRDPSRGEVYAPVRFGYLIALVHRRLSILDNPLELPYPDPEYAANPDVLPNRRQSDPVPVTIIIRPAMAGEIDLETVRMPILPSAPTEATDESESEGGRDASTDGAPDESGGAGGDDGESGR